MVPTTLYVVFYAVFGLGLNQTDLRSVPVASFATLEECQAAAATHQVVDLRWNFLDRRDLSGARRPLARGAWTECREGETF